MTKLGTVPAPGTTKTRYTYSVISEDLIKGDQGWNFRRVVSCKGQKIKISLYRDTYDFQSYARASRWDGDKWQPVHELPFPECEFRKVSAYQNPPPTAKDFEADFNRLLGIALEIVL